MVVDVQLTNEAKAYLDANYVNGAYVEGYVYAKPVDSVDGAVGVTHSIPVLGFYGNWSDHSMYDQVTYTGVLYGDKTVPYLNVRETNNRGEVPRRFRHHIGRLQPLCFGGELSADRAAVHQARPPVSVPDVHDPECGCCDLRGYQRCR